jgi:hypothetical protein
MKLINHNKNNHYDLDTYVMGGTITMTDKEYETSLRFLQNEYKKAVKTIDTYKRDSLSGLVNRMPQTYKGYKLVDLGVTATQLLIKKHNLKGYKPQNYGIKVIY